MPDEMLIPTIADLERILDENPAIRESLRRKLLTDEERQLPRIVEQLAENVSQLTQAMVEGFAQAAEDRAIIKADVAQIKTDVAGLKTDVADLKSGQQLLQGQFNQFRGENYEVRVQSQAVSYSIIQMGFTNPHISRPVNAGNSPQFNSVLQQALSDGSITTAHAMDLCNADLIISGDDNQHLVAEISITASDTDIERAVRRAGIMKSATKGLCTPAIIAQNVPEPQSNQAKAHDVAVMLFT